MILIPVAGVISFVSFFGLAWFTAPEPDISLADANQQADIAGSQEVNNTHAVSNVTEDSDIFDTRIKKSLTEAQLEELIYDIREKVKEYNGKIASLGVREQRLQQAHDLIKKDIEELMKLQGELAMQVGAIKDEKKKLEKSKVEIARTEKDNIAKIAAFYDKMDGAAASKILSNMIKIKSIDEVSNFNDAIKILHYMTDRTKAKLLAELSNTEPELAAAFCKKLKRVVEIN
jgi:hypothetical protein